MKKILGFGILCGSMGVSSVSVAQEWGEVIWEDIEVILSSGEVKKYTHHPLDTNVLYLPIIHNWKCKVFSKVDNNNQTMFIRCSADGTNYISNGAICRYDRIGDVDHAEMILSSPSLKESPGMISIMCSVHPKAR